MLLVTMVTKASVTMPCETFLLGKLKIPMAVYILFTKGIDSILCYPGSPVDARSQAGNTSSPSVFSVVEWDLCFRCMQLTT